MNSMDLTLRKVQNTHPILILWMYILIWVISFLTYGMRNIYLLVLQNILVALESLIEHPKEDHPPMYMNHSKEAEVFEVVDD